MQASIRLVNGQNILADFLIPFERLNKAEIETCLKEKYELDGGYEISYMDDDGDEITVEFDEDYEVARLTHDDTSLVLMVKILNEGWIEWFQKRKQDEINAEYQLLRKDQPKDLLSINQPVTIDLLSGDIPEQQVPQEQKPQQKIQATETLVEKSTEEQKIEDQKPVQIAEPEEQIILKPKEVEENLNLLKKTIPLQCKRTETQTSQLQSLDQASQTKPEKRPITDLFSIERQFIQQETDSEQPDILQPKAPEKPKNKKKKQINSKLEKKKKGLSEKDIKKLVKKEVFKLLPQITQKLKFAQDSDSSESDNAITLTNLKTCEILNENQCFACLQELRVPFYINSSEGIKLCHKCQETDDSTFPLIKIRDPLMLENLTWAQPLYSMSKSRLTEQKGQTKLFTQLKKQFLSKVKNEFDERIKAVKEQTKKDKKLQKILKQAIKKHPSKQVKQESLI